MNKTIKTNLFVKEIFKVLDKENFKGLVREVDPSKHCVLDFTGYFFDNLKLMIHEGDWIKIGQPLLHLKNQSSVQYPSLCSGKVVKIERGEKRRLERIVILRDEKQDSFDLKALAGKDVSKESFVEHMNFSGAAFRVFARPCKRVADLTKTYDALFVNAAKDLPYALPLSFQMKEHQEAIYAALAMFKRFYPVHFIASQEHDNLESGIQCHRSSDNWQASLTSFHIHKINPILSLEQRVLTIDLQDLIYCGYSFLGKWHTKKHLYLWADGVKPEAKGLYAISAGQTIDDLLQDKVQQGELQIISADPLTGKQVDRTGAALPSDTVLTVLKQQKVKRALYHLRATSAAFTTSAGYLQKKGNACNNNLLFGESRAFIAQEYYDHTIPLDLDIVPLIKAILAQDYEKAVFLGLLEVDREDFALATFVCPSKIEMMQIVQEGQKQLLLEHDL